MGPVLSRIVTLLALFTTVAFSGDVALILCFGEDGHVAFERLICAEHLGAGTAGRVNEIVARASNAPFEHAHVDVSVGEAGIKSRHVTPMGPSAVPSLDTVLIASATRPVASCEATEASALCAVRTTVLRI